MGRSVLDGRLLWVAALAIAAGCGTAPDGGSSGAGATGGRGGSGDDGSSGTGGDGGAAGTSGFAGAGAAAGDGGAAGAAGASGSGQGGAAGASTPDGAADGAGGCAPGTGDCNGNSADGCETDLTKNLAHCGACGKACVSGPNSTAKCSGGWCALECAKPWSDCNADATDGCETNLDTDGKHCGVCGNDCKGAACLGGACQCAGQTFAAQKGMVDIIFAIDTSGSMSTEIVQVKQNINNFAQTIGKSGLDYRVIMIAARGTGSYQVCVPPPLGGASCGDNPPIFYHVNQTVASTNSLSLILSTYDNPNPALAWNKYVRFDALKAFVEVTDDNSFLASSSFDTSLLAKAPPSVFGTAQKRKYVFHSICGWQQGTPILSSTKCSSAVNIGAEYQKLSQLTGGIVDSVCKTDYSGVLNNIAKGIVQKLGCEYLMPKAGDAGTVAPDKVVVQYTPGGGAPQKLVRVTDASKCGSVPNGWYYDDNVNPTKILLCPSICTTVGNDPAAKIEVLVGYQAPPPQ